VWHDLGMGDGQPPAELLRAGGLEVLPGDVRTRDGRAWLVVWQERLAVLRQSPGARPEYEMAACFLARLAGLGFPSPCPLPVFGGRSHLTTAGMLWEVVSYLPGQVVGGG
jgi:hypothetical protein